MYKKHDCKEELRAAGSRATPGRLALLRVLEGERKPVSVGSLRQKIRSLDQVTLYRALNALVSSGLVHKGELDRVTHFEYAGRSHHHHMACIDCGYVKQCASC